MERLHSILRDIALATVPVVGAFLIWTLWPVRAGTTAILAKSEKAVDGVNATLANINAPCTGFHGSVTCGTLAQISQSTKDIGIVASQSALQVKQSGVLISAAANGVSTVAAHVSTTADSLSGTAKAATGTLQQAQTDLQTANESIAASKPLIDAATVAMNRADKTAADFDALVESPDVASIMKSSAVTSQQVSVIATQGAGIATDIHKEADALTAPKPWYEKLGAYGSTGVNVACLVTHSCPF